MKLVVCDDHRLFAEAIGEYLRSCGFDVVGVATDPEEAVAICRRTSADVCFMGLRYSVGVLAIPAIGALADSGCDTRVIAVTSTPDDDAVPAAVEAGAVGAVAKSASVEAIIDVLRRVEADEVVIPQSALRKITQRAGSRGNPAGGLTQRELDVLELLCGGASTSAIAAELCISVATVRTHVQSILTKLGAHSKLEAVTISLAQGLTVSTSA